MVASPSKYTVTLDCPACGKTLAVESDVTMKTSEVYDATVYTVDMDLKLDHDSWSKAHGDDNCALKDLSQVEK